MTSKDKLQALFCAMALAFLCVISWQAPCDKLTTDEITQQIAACQVQGRGYTIIGNVDDRVTKVMCNHE